MNIQIQPELEQIIQAQIATGRYANPEEVISKALKLLLEWEKVISFGLKKHEKRLRLLLNN
ncbi:hypothetical protein Anacy_2437 [Anabaena cylindrica PCC 7122]|uniref:Addiction module antidote protein, CC2985 family n=1 Tax=Anabaena cylindrica (strain ATCC 27899 / PCC 7122) TaxID=272123 RepID=K9ZH53_ANACC|nr:hypothetical protein Anacy_2437 [Anabaena cylindrica PCC 7122]BAY05152.1 hypothetical protein NIES19_44210 [Anabaena cylindrica PCC 7122]